ncbi:dachshund homolog 2-like [Oncorhynchus clarkii lewisi]|uniref:dachshund homolog 2-like n=1 Tax=Oncorhynchus clarkii lewisi TaxID=490388 RepID=UPI0039B9831A
MSTTMAVPATPPVLSPGSGAPSSLGIFRSDPIYTATTTSPHPDSPSPPLTTTGLLNPFLTGSGVPSGGLGFANTPVFRDRGISTTTTTTTTSECRMVDVHGVKVASFSVGGQDDLICLPQVFDLFLKHLVGGLHTVYTKLKRLDICPVVCTVSQVRVLRGLGAIQPGVNRCKLISRRDFEALYTDCTMASSRPGRPPKHSVGGGIQESSRHLHPGVHGLLSPGMLSHKGLQDLPFLMMTHPLLPVRVPPASVAMAMSQMNHLNTIANMAAAAQMHTYTHQAPIVKERVCDSPSPSPSVDGIHTPLLSQQSSQPSSTASSSPDRLTVDRDVTERQILVNKIDRVKEDSSLALPMSKPSFDRLSPGQALPPGFPAHFLFADGVSSVETLLTNIQGLLKVAVENARVQDTQIQAEKRGLKMELYREREMRESLERQLTSELQSKASIQKRLKKEKKAKRKLQEALEFESKRRETLEHSLKHSSSMFSSPSPPDTLHTGSNDLVVPED